MRWLKAIIGELFALFVEDGSFALAIVVWLVTVWLLLPHLSMPPSSGGTILFIGLALILVENVVRRSGR
jgi:hypothetical protein